MKNTDSIESLVFYFRSFPLSLKPIKIEPVLELSRVVRFVKLAKQGTGLDELGIQKEILRVHVHKIRSGRANKKD